VTVNKAARDVVGMRKRPVHGSDDGDGFAPLAAQFRRPGAKTRRRLFSLGADRRGADPAAEGEGGGGGEKFAPRAALMAVEHGEISQGGVGLAHVIGVM